MAVRFFSLSLLVALMAGAPLPSAHAEASEEPWAFDVFFIPAFPPVYDALLGSFDDLHQICPGTPASDLKLFNNLLKIPGHLANILSFANAIDAGDHLDAAISGGLNGASLMLDIMGASGMDKITLTAFGSSSALNLTVVGALVTSLQITYASYKLAVQNETGRVIESLYGSIEADAHFKTPGRKYGEGDPIRKDAKMRDYVWNKILADSAWRELFKTYVTSELGQEWPEPSMWESMKSVTAEAKIVAEERRLKGHILSLLDQVNNYKKAREAAVRDARKMRKLSEASNGAFTAAQLQAALVRAGAALKGLPRAEDYANTGLDAKLKEFKDELAKPNTPARRLLILRSGIIPAEIKNLRNWAGIIQGLPTKGKYAEQRQAILKKLESGQKSLVDLIKSIPGEKIDELAKKEELAIMRAALGSAGSLSEAATEDAVMKYFKFKRRPCEKKYEDYVKEIRSAVEDGEPGEAEKSRRVIEEAQRAAQKLEGEYESDRHDREKSEYLKTYDEVAPPLNEKIAQAVEEFNRTKAEPYSSSKHNRLNAIQRKIDALKREKALLEANLRAVMSELDMYETLDVGQAKEIVRRLNDYTTSWRARSANVTSLLQATLDDAMSKASAFQPPFPLLSRDEIQVLRKLMSKAGTTYPGTSGYDYLKTKNPVDPSASPLTAFHNRLKELSELSKAYAEKVNALRIPLAAQERTSTGDWAYVSQLLKNVVPALEYIEKGDFARQRALIEEVLATANRFFDERHELIPKAFEEQFDAMENSLKLAERAAKAYTAEYSTPSASSAEVEAFVKTAEENNQRVIDDLDSINRLYEHFWKADIDVGQLIAHLLINVASQDGDGSLPLLASRELQSVLNKFRLTEIDVQANLGLAELLAEPWAVTQTRDRRIVIRQKDLEDFLAAITAAPYSSLSTVMAEARKTSPPADLLMENRSERGQACAFQLKVIPEYAEIGKKIDAMLAAKQKQARDEFDAENKAQTAELLKIYELQRELEMTRFTDAEARGARLEQFRKEMQAATKGFSRTTAEIAALNAKIDQYIKDAKERAGSRKNLDAMLRAKLDQLADAYRKRSASGILELFARDFRGGWENLRVYIDKDFGLFSSLAMTLHPMFVTAQDDRAEAEFEWRNESVYKKGGAVASRTGRSRLIFQKGADGQWLIQDAEGDPFLGIGTERVGAPQVVSFSPAQGQSNVSPSEQVTVDFSENMDAGTITAALTIDPRTDVNLDYFGFNLTIHPRTSWPENTSIRVRLSKEALSAFGIGLDHELDFTFRTTTAAAAPAPPPPASSPTITGNATITPFEGFDFGSQRVVFPIDPSSNSNGCDFFSYGGDSLRATDGAGLIDMGSGRLANFTTAPTSGYGMAMHTVQSGHVYMVQTSDLRYAKMLVSGGGPHHPIDFRYVFQPDGGTNLPGE